MGFSFSTTAGASQSSVKPRLAGNDIYTVVFDGCEIQDIQGVKDASMVYKVLKLKFSNEDGSFEHTVFEPRDTDSERPEKEYTTKEGKKESFPQPSGIENMMLLFKHAIDSINPTIGKQIDEGTQNLGANSWDGLRKLVEKILNAGKGTTVKIKLLKNNKGEAQFPGFFTGLTKPDPITGISKAYIRNNFIGNKVAFTAYEAQKITNENTAKVTKVSSFGNTATNAAEFTPDSIGDLDFDLPSL